MATPNLNTRGTGSGVDLAKPPGTFDLQSELQKVLSNSNFSFTGSFYHGSILSNTPNPCLTIEGLGLIGLPIGERDAKAIIDTCATRPVVASRRGRGRGKAKGARPKKETQRAWEIEPAKVSFANTVWQNYVDTTLSVMLCKSLGVRIGASLPKLELAKLLVYETGAHLLPDEKADKIDGVFGTATILLPSAYTGGQVVVSHASATQTIDFAKDSMLSTALLGWYNDVKYEVKLIESGFRLALVYNLVQIPQENGGPFPGLPDMTSSTNELQCLLEKWKGDRENKNLPPYIAYLLKERHDPFVFKVQGLKVLKGVDLHRTTVVRTVSEAVGVRVYIASLEHKISGFSEDTYQKRRRNRYDSYLEDLGLGSDDDDDNRYITEVNSVTTKITELQDMDGASVLAGSDMDIESSCLVPSKPFEGEAPDETKDDGYVCSQLVYCYRRTALVLMPEDTADEILFNAIGTSYAYRMLSKSKNLPPTSDDCMWAERLLKGGNSLKEWHILLLLQSALKWKDIELWKSTATCPSCTVAILNSKTLVNPMEIFTFEELRPSFEASLAKSKSLNDNMDFISRFASKGSGEENNGLNAWFQQEVTKIVSSYSSAKVEDVPTLLSIIRVIGLQSFQKLLLPNLEKHHQSYGFWMTFVKALCKDWTVILQQQSLFVSAMAVTNTPMETQSSASPTATAEVILRSIVKQGLKLASTEWNYAGFGPDYYFNPYSNTTPTLIRIVKLDRIIEVIEQAIGISDVETIKILFEDILTNKWFNAFQRINDIFLPLLPLLRELLTKKNLNQFQSPFVEFIRSFVGLYLREILGKRTELSTAHMRKVGCPAAGVCAHCKLLDDFIMNPKIRTTLIRAPKRDRLHLQQRADNALDLYKYEIVTSTSPHGLQFTKLQSVLDASTWPARQKAAKLFLDAVGSGNDLSRIMGNRILDVKHAFEGSRPYDAPVPPTPIPTSTTASGNAVTSTGNPAMSTPAGTVPQVSTAASTTSTAVARKASATGFPQRVTSKKRKS